MSRIFISWSGRRAKKVADNLAEFLRNVESSWTPWVSSQIQVGRPWLSGLRGSLAESKYGILCITEENRDSPWILFEAGALAAQISNRESDEPTSQPVCPFLVGADLRASDLEFPLGMFQVIQACQRSVPDEAAVRRLVASIYRTLGPTDDFGPRFRRHWAKLRDDLKNIIAEPAEINYGAQRRAFTDRFSKLLADIDGMCDSSGFRGQLFIYNIELHTLTDSPRIWDYLLSKPEIEQIHLVIAPHVFKRLETQLATNAEIRQMFLTTGKTFHIYPVDIPKQFQRFAFGYFKDEREIPDKLDFCYEFLKIETYARWSEVNGRDFWRFRRFNRIAQNELTAPLLAEVERCLEIGPGFSLADVEAFGIGEGQPVDVVLDRHNIARNEYRPALLSYPLDIDAMDETRQPESLFNGVNAARELPYLLWVPPWGFPLWHQTIAGFDGILSERFQPLYFRYPMTSRRYTFTLSEYSLCLSLQELERRCREQDRSYTVIAISVNAYVLLCVLRAFVERQELQCLNKVVLLCPTIDLFDGLDAFRNATLLTRRFCAAMTGFRAVDPRVRERTEYFGKSIDPPHLLDLCVRGRRHSSADWFRESLETLLQHCRVLVGHNLHDEMTRYCEVEEIVTALARLGWDISLCQIEWYHAIRAGHFVAPIPANREQVRSLGFERVREFLFEPVATHA